MYFPNLTTCDVCGQKAHGVHECNVVHVVDHQRAMERKRIVARLRQLAAERDRRIGTPEWHDAAEPARFLNGVATEIEAEK